MAVRRESVRLELHDDLSPGMARAAAATQLLKRQLNDLSGTSVQTSRTTRAFAKDVGTAGTATRKMGGDADAANRPVVRLTGSMKMLVDIAALLGPAFIPVGAIAVPAVTGLAQQLGFAAVAGGSAIVAFQGVGDALTAVNDAALEPTTDNLRAAEDALARLSPAAADFVTELAGMRDAWQALRDAGAEALFPGLIESLDHLESRLPDLERIIVSSNEALADLVSGGAESLASGRWDDFFEFLATDAPSALSDLGAAVGNTTHALAEMWMAFDPINDDFSSWLVDLTARFDDWATGLSQTQGFTDFIEYLRESGPQVASSMSALGDAVLQVLEAMSPLGGPVLAGIEALSEAIAGIAESPLGPPIMAGVTALILFNRAAAVTSGLMASTWGAKAVGNIRGAAGALMGVTTASERAQTSVAGHAQAERDRRAAMRRGIGTAGRLGAGIAGLALASSDAADGLGATAGSFGLMGAAIGGPWGAAIGSAIGLAQGLRSSNDDLEGAIKRANDAMASGSPREMADALEVLQGAVDTTKSKLDDLDLGELAQFGLGGGIGFLMNWGDAASFAEGAFAELTGTTREGEEAIRGLRGAMDGSRGGLAELMSGGRLTADAFDTATASAEAFGESLARLNRLLEGRANMRDYQAALDDFTASMRENGRTFDINTEKGRANQAALDDIVGTALQVAEGLEGIERVKFLQGTAQQVRQLARQFDIPRSQVRGLLDELADLGAKKPEPEVDVNGVPRARGLINTLQGDLDRYGLTTANATAALNDVASGRIRSIQGLIDKYGLTKAQAAALLADFATGKINGVLSALRNLDGQTANTSTTHTITTIRRTVRQVTQAGPVLDFLGNADGGTIPKTGQPYADRHPYLLADGEEVISNRHGQADKHRELLKAINANRLADGGTAGFPGLANGGTASGGFGLGPGAIAALDQFLAAIREAANAQNDLTRAQRRAERVEDRLANAQGDRATYRERLEQNARIRDVRRSLRARGRDRLRGLDRRIAYAQLREERRELNRMRTATRRVAAARRELAKANEELAKAEHFDETRVQAMEQGGQMLLGRSPASASRRLNRLLSDVRDFNQVFGNLREAGSSPWLLSQLQAAAQSGDYASAVRFGRSLLRDQEQFTLLEAQGQALSTLAAQQSAVTYGISTPGRRIPMGQTPMGQAGATSTTVNFQIQSDQVEQVAAAVITRLEHSGVL